MDFAETPFAAMGGQKLLNRSNNYFRADFLRYLGTQTWREVPVRFSKASKLGQTLQTQSPRWEFSSSLLPVFWGTFERSLSASLHLQTSADTFRFQVTSPPLVGCTLDSQTGWWPRVSTGLASAKSRKAISAAGKTQEIPRGWEGSCLSVPCLLTF